MPKLSLPIRPSVRKALQQLAASAAVGGMDSGRAKQRGATPEQYAADLLEVVIIERFQQVFGTPLNKLSQLGAR